MTATRGAPGRMRSEQPAKDVRERELRSAYLVALIVVDDTTLAERVVVQAFAELAVLRSALAAPGRQMVVLAAIHRALHELAATAAPERLPLLQRQAFAYCCHGGASTHEAAELLGEAPEVVCRQLGLALRTLRLALVADASSGEALELLALHRTPW